MAREFFFCFFFSWAAPAAAARGHGTTTAVEGSYHGIIKLWYPPPCTSITESVVAQMMKHACSVLYYFYSKRKALRRKHWQYPIPIIRKRFVYGLVL